MSNPKVWIQTWSGRKFDLVNPTPEMVDLRDIAEALAKANRYTGHTLRPYSVAQHSVWCSRHVSRPAEAYALLHDAHEAYLRDKSTPQKEAEIAVVCEALEEHRGVVRAVLRTLADRTDAAIFARFGLTWPCDPGTWMQVKNADALALATERRDLLRHKVEWDYLMPDPDAVKLVPLPWWDAAEEFMKRAREVGLK